MKLNTTFQSGRLFSLLIALTFILMACGKNESTEPTDTGSDSTDVSVDQVDYQPVTHPAWSRNAVIYEVNLRQYSPGGTFNEFTADLPRVKELGVDILWLMPIFPIGEKNRKGGLGSYYSIKDYQAVNPEHGTLADLKNLVAEAHKLDMKVILDWVANHSSWDNALMTDHPEWYTKDSAGNFQPPVKDWADVADLNYEEKGLWSYMIESMKYWITEADVDGFRCDVAMMVPMEFWNQARMELDKVKDVFVLAEAEGPEFHQHAFDMTYGWDLHHLMNKLVKEEKSVSDLKAFFGQEQAKYNVDDYRMQFITNHDENSWNGTVWERMGEDAAYTFAVFSATIPGMHLIYSGQEAGMDKRLEFFEKDQIEWRAHPMGDLYKKLNALKRAEAALHNGDSGGPMTMLNSDQEDIFAFVREKGESKVLVILNFSDADLNANLEGDALEGVWTNVLEAGEVTFGAEESVEIGAWGYKVYKL